MSNRFQQRKKFLHRGNFLVIKQDIRFLEFCVHFLRVSYEIGRNVTAVELHTFNHFYFGFSTFGFLHRDHAFFGHFLHGLSDQCSDIVITVGRDTGNLTNFVIVFTNSFFLFLQILHYFSNSFVDTSLQIHRVRSGSHVFQAHVDDRLSQDRCGCSSISGIITCFGCHFFYHLCSDVCIRIRKFDLFCHGNTIFGNMRGTEFFLDYHVTSFGAKRYFHCISQFVNTLFQ